MEHATEARISTLERQIRCARRVSIGCAILTAAVALGFVAREWRASKVPADLRVRSITVLDDAGGIAARLGSSFGGGTLVLRADKANGRVLIGAMNDDVGLGIVVADQTRISLLVSRDGFPALSLYDAAGNNRLLAGISGKDSAAVLLRSATGKPRLVLSSDSSAALTVMDTNGAEVGSFPATRASHSD